MSPFLLTSFYGLLHAFEADHVLAVSSLVSNRQKMGAAIKDGIFWGLGHTFTILCFGLLFKVFSISFPESVFAFFEGIVGLMLVGIGLSRIRIFFQNNQIIKKEAGQKAAFSTGVVHGLAGSGSLILLLLPQVAGELDSIMSLALFGFGSLAGMAVAAAIGFLPFYKRNLHKAGRWVLLGSAILCIGYGIFVFVDNVGEFLL